MLGRARMQVREKHRTALAAVLAENGFDLGYDDLTQPDGYAESFFKALGLGPVSSLDMSDFEGADIQHDLNVPIVPDLEGRFGLVYDGGTTEHVFDVSSCMDNLARLLRPGGVLAACVPGNGWFAHGFYQFGPELVYGYWKHARRFEVLTCSILPEMPRDKEIAIPDPAELGHRPRMRGKVPAQRVHLYYEVRKGPQAQASRPAFQTDYVNRWGTHDAALQRSGTAPLTLHQAQADNIRGRQR